MKVKATKLGFYDQRRRKEGEIFFLHSPKFFSSKWMEKLDDEKKYEPKVESVAVSEPEVTSEEDVI